MPMTASVTLERFVPAVRGMLREGDFSQLSTDVGIRVTLSPQEVSSGTWSGPINIDMALMPREVVLPQLVRQLGRSVPCLERSSFLGNPSGEFLDTTWVGAPEPNLLFSADAPSKMMLAIAKTFCRGRGRADEYQTRWLIDLGQNGTVWYSPGGYNGTSNYVNVTGLEGYGDYIFSMADLFAGLSRVEESRVDELLRRDELFPRESYDLASLPVPISDPQVQPAVWVYPRFYRAGHEKFIPHVGNLETARVTLRFLLSLHRAAGAGQG